MIASEGGQGSAGQDPVEPLSLSLAPASRRRAFRIWRRSRPFWGGLLLLLAGLEMLAIPLLSVLAHTSVKVIIYIGIGGVFGVLIGGLLVACGLLIWFHPSQRDFYAIAGVLLAVVSFVATNLGGFFVGMLLGVTGGSLSFAWGPVGGREPAARRHRRPRTTTHRTAWASCSGTRRAAAPHRATIAGVAIGSWPWRTRRSSCPGWCSRSPWAVRCGPRRRSWSASSRSRSSALLRRPRRHRPPRPRRLPSCSRQPCSRQPCSPPSSLEPR